MTLRIGVSPSAGAIIIAIEVAFVAIAGSVAFKYVHAEYLFEEGLKAYHHQDFDRAKDFWSKSLAEQKQVPALSFQYSESASNLGYMAYLSGRNDEGKRLLREAIAIQSKLGKDWHKAMSMHLLGLICMREGHLAEAESLLKEAHFSLKRLRGEDDIDTVDSAHSLQKLARLRESQKS